jgi:hypothetical protein
MSSTLGKIIGRASKETQIRIVGAGISASMLFWLLGLIWSLRVAGYNMALTNATFAGVLHSLGDDCSLLAWLLGAVLLFTCVGIFEDLFLGTQKRWAQALATISDWTARITFFGILLLGSQVFYSQPDPYSLSRASYLVKGTTFLLWGERYFWGAALVLLVLVAYSLLMYVTENEK